MSKDRFFFELLRGHRLLRALGLSPIEKKLVISSVGGRWTYENIKEQARIRIASERGNAHWPTQRRCTLKSPGARNPGERSSTAST